MPQTQTDEGQPNPTHPFAVAQGTKSYTTTGFPVSQS